MQLICYRYTDIDCIFLQMILNDYFKYVNIMMMVMMIPPNTVVHVRGAEGRGGRIWGEEGGNADYGVQPSQQSHGATQSETCCTMCKRGWVGIGHARFENSSSVLGRNPALFSLDSRVINIIIYCIIYRHNKIAVLKNLILIIWFAYTITNKPSRRTGTTKERKSK